MGADLSGRDLSIDIANHFIGRANVRPDEAGDIAILDATHVKFAEGDVQSLLKDLAGIGRQPDPTDIDHMAAAGKESDDLTAVEYGGHNAHVVELASELVRVVRDEHVAGLDRIDREFLEEEIASRGPWC